MLLRQAFACLLARTRDRSLSFILPPAITISCEKFFFPLKIVNIKHKHTNWLLPNETYSHTHTRTHSHEYWNRRRPIHQRIFNCDVFTIIIRHSEFSRSQCNCLHCWCVSLSVKEKKLLHLKSLNHLRRNMWRIKWSLKKKKKKTERKWVYAKKSEGEQKMLRFFDLSNVI